MHIHLKNFRQHKDLNLDLPDSGIVLLKAPSGFGKSTILDAIEDSLYGTVRDIKPWGGGKPHEHLIFAGMEIERSYTPNSLAVTINGQTSTDDAAQQAIYNHLGMTHHEFMACSYIKQEGANSLLNLGPTGIMRFVQSLCSKKIDPELVKEQIAGKIKTCKSDLQDAEARLSEVSSSLSEAKENIPAVPQKPNNPECELFSLLPEAQAEKTRLEKLAYDFEQASLSLKTAESNKQEKLNELSAHKEQRGKLESELDQLRETYSKEKEGDLKQLSDKYQKKSEWLLCKSDILKISAEILESFEDAPKDGKLTDWCKQKIQSLDEQAFKNSGREIEVKRQIDALKNWDKDVLECPCCSAALKLDGKVLKEASKRPEDYEKRLKELEEQRSAAAKNFTDLRDQANSLRHNLQKAMDLKERLKNDPLPEVKTQNDLQERVEQLNTEIKSVTAKRERINELRVSVGQESATIKSIEAANAENDRKITESQSKMKEVADFVDAAVTDDIPELLKTRIQKVNNDCELMTKYQQDLKVYESKIADRNSWLKYVENLSKQKQVAEARVDKCTSELASAERLKDFSDQAAALAIEEKMDEINQNAADLLDQFFADDGTTIRLSSFSTTQAGKEKAEAGINIYHKGKKAKKLGQLSGGEKSRARLAFQLGLSKLYGSPILMIDEGFAGLNADLVEDCFEALAEFSQNKLILVAEHFAPEAFFDEVIQL